MRLDRVLCASLLLSFGACGPAPTLADCPVFPRSNPWNADVSGNPVSAGSAAYITAIGAATSLRADFGEDQSAGIPYVVVPGGQPPVGVDFVDYPKESDPGPYPVPTDAPIEASGDHHVLVVQAGECRLYELYNASYVGPGWRASNGAVFDLTRNDSRPQGWTSADAAGLPILPGLVRYDEIAAGQINHALRFTVPRTQTAYFAPATHATGNRSDPTLPPMGLRVRLKGSVDLTKFTGASLVILRALQRYGMLVADNGSAWYLSGAPDSRWVDDDLRQLRQIHGSDLEAVDTGPLLHLPE